MIENMLYKINKISLELPLAVSNAGEKIRFFSWVTMLSRSSCFKNRLNSVKSEMCHCSGNGLVYDYDFWSTNKYISWKAVISTRYIYIDKQQSLKVPH